MMMMMTMSLIMSFSFLLILMKEPLSIGSLVLLNSLMMSISIYYQGNLWLGFILFLIYVGGMLVMFAYITALVPNLSFKSKGLLKIFFLILAFWLFLFFKLELLGISIWNNNLIFHLSYYYNSLGASLFSLFNSSSMIGLVTILLFILICVVKICYFNKGALRPFKYA